MLEGLLVGGYDLPALITEGSVRSSARKHSITGSTGFNTRVEEEATGFSSLSKDALRVLDHI